jgi:hypothetical protein
VNWQKALTCPNSSFKIAVLQEFCYTLKNNNIPAKGESWAKASIPAKYIAAVSRL